MRNMDVDLANKFIPFLEAEVIDGNKSRMFLSKLEEIYRNEAYTKYVTRLKQQNSKSIGQSKKQGLEDADDLVDTATHDRRRQIHEKIRKIKHSITSKTSVESSSYKSVVKEFEYDVQNPFTGILQKLLVTGRKLKPVVRRREPVVADGITECKIFVHLVKGENVPIRVDYIEDYKKAKPKSSMQLEDKANQVPGRETNIADP